MGHLLEPDHGEKLEMLQMYLTEICKDTRVDVTLRLKVLEIIELRSLGWNTNPGMESFYQEKISMFEKKEDVYITRDDFKRAIQELNVYSNPLQRKAIEFEYTNWLNPADPVKNRMQVDRLTGDWQFTCPVVEFAHR